MSGSPELHASPRSGCAASPACLAPLRPCEGGRALEQAPAGQGSYSREGGSEAEHGVPGGHRLGRDAEPDDGHRQAGASGQEQARQNTKRGNSAVRRNDECADVKEYGMHLEPVIHLRAGSAGSQFFRVQGGRSDADWTSASDERRRNGKNWPQPFGFHPSTQRPRAGSPGLRRKSRHTSLSSSPWNSQSLRPPPRLARFSRATPSTGKFITGSSGGKPLPRKNPGHHRRSAAASGFHWNAIGHSGYEINGEPVQTQMRQAISAIIQPQIPA